ncbi:MAG: hypothetical protein RLZZ200_1232, partial [Pseudomonadota bacterium]
GRLREACQTDVDGTSIDTMETVAGQLGLVAEQKMIPQDHLLLDSSRSLPAVVVVRGADISTHFVVVWRRIGAWLQVMDPAVGRRWVRASKFLDDVFDHEMSVPRQDWADWARTDEFIQPLRERLAAIGATDADADRLVREADAYPGWYGFGTLDACLRMVRSVVAAGGLERGGAAVALLSSLIARTLDSENDIFALIPPDYWSVSPDPASRELGAPHLLLRGVVLVRVTGRSEGAPAPTSPELVAALKEPSPTPLREFWKLLRADGQIAPLALLGAVLVAAGAVLLETLLFRGIFEVSEDLHLPGQRLLAVVGLLVFVATLMLVRIPILTEVLRFGRHVEVRLRMALLKKLPNLPDRYFQSRPVSDMAERSHGIHATRVGPGLALSACQGSFELLLTFAGVVWIDPPGFWLALLIVALAMALPLIAQPMLTERDLRVRNHAGAMGSFYLDAMLGLAAVRTHRAEAAVRRQHEGLLSEWARAARSQIRMALALEGLQSLLGVALCGILLMRHFTKAGGVSGADLLLVYWTLKLPALGAQLAGLARQIPAQRNVLLRLMEPLTAPQDMDEESLRQTRDAQPVAGKGGVSIVLRDARVVAGGHTILQDVDLTIAPGEHVAIVGPSGAGKSTLVGLLLGWHRLASGRLRVDGRALDASSQQSLRRRTAWVDPGVQLWNRSFLDNIRYGSGEDSLGRVGDVLQAASLQKVLAKLPAGLQTVLGEGGALLSGGEGQRVRLARAFLQEGVQLALLDEPFRGLDRRQRGELLGEARKWWRDATLVCVTHDVGETLGFDRVLVVENGRIVEDGVPAELVMRPSRYRDLQQAEERLRRQLWASDRWRHVSVRDGLAQEAG